MSTAPIDVDLRTDVAPVAPSGSAPRRGARLRTAEATATKVRQGLDTKARALRDAGWIVIAPDEKREVFLADDGRLLCPYQACETGDEPEAGDFFTMIQFLRGLLGHIDRHRERRP